MADNDRIELSSAALAALAEFMKEKKEAETAHQREAQATDKVTLVTAEDWELSQFWYDADTCKLLASEVFAQANAIAAELGSCNVAVLSAPSTYKAMLSLGIPSNVTASILEYDRRFGDAFGASYGFYDYNHPSDFPAHLRAAVDLVVLDPPFLQHDCLAAFAQTVQAMARPGRPLSVMLCSGSIMLSHARALLDVRPVCARVRHEGGRLSNPFSLYLSAAQEQGASRCGGWDTEAEEAAARDLAAS